MPAFGKSEDHLAGTPRFGGRGSRANNPFGGGGSGGGPKFSGPFIRNLILFPGQTFWAVFHAKEYTNLVVDAAGTTQEVVLPYRRIFQHWHNQARRFSICSGGPAYWDAELSSELCSGCHSYHSNQKKVPDPKKPGKFRWENFGPVSKSEAYAFSLAVLERFYEVPDPKKVDADGLPRVEIVMPGHPLLPRPNTPTQKAELAKRVAHEGQRFIFTANKSHLAQLFGAEGQASASIDEELRSYCASCKEKDAINEGAGPNEEDVCTTCEALDSRAHLFNVAIQLKAVPGVAKMGRDGKMGKPPINLTMVKWCPLDAFFAENPQFDRTALMDPVDLDVKVAPSTPEQQAKIYGSPPRRTAQGSTEMVDPGEGDSEDTGEAPPPDDGIPF